MKVKYRFSGKDPIFRTVLEVVVCDNDYIDKLLDGYGYTADRTHRESAANTYRLRDHNSSSRHNLIALKPYKIEALVHELVHNAMITCMDKGITVANDEDEVVCYLTEYWLGRILKTWNSQEEKVLK